MPSRKPKRGLLNGQTQYIVRLSDKEKAAVDVIAAQYKLQADTVIQTLVAVQIERHGGPK
jgi:hypothetical protein